MHHPQLWLVTNLTGTNVSFDDKTLEPAKSVNVSRLTDDIAAGVYQGKLAIYPSKIGADGHNFAGCVTLNPSSFPIPVKVIGQHACPEPLVVVDRPPVIVCRAQPCLVFESDARRRSFTIRNGSSTATLAIGGCKVSLDTSVRILPPGASLTETLVAPAEWYAISTEDNARLLVSAVLAQALIC